MGTDLDNAGRPLRGAGLAHPTEPLAERAHSTEAPTEGPTDRALRLERARLETFHRHALRHGVNPIFYWVARAFLQPFFHIYFRFERVGMEHVPRKGPLIIASNHRSFLDPFMVAALLRRPLYFVAKKELFRRRWQAWILNSLGAFPVDRGAGDEDAMATARAIIERGDCVVIFPEGTRVRPGPIGSPRHGVGRLALETGAQVVPVAVIGTEAIRRGWRIRPHKVSIRVGRPLTFPTVERPSMQLAGAVTERIWACISLQWEWLGGALALREASPVERAVLDEREVTRAA